MERGARKWSFRETTRESYAAQRLFQFELESMRYTARAINSRSERKGRTRRFTNPLSRVIRARRQRVASMPEIKEPVERSRERERERERVEERNGRIQSVIPLIRLRRQSTHRPRILSELAGLPDDRAVSDYFLLTSI